MKEFNIENLDKMKEEMRSRFPMPREFALTDKSIANEILYRMKEEQISFAELPISDLNFAYQLAGAVDKKDFAALKTAFRSRVTQTLFDIGWIFCQWNPSNEAAVALFMIACDWMKANKSKEYDESLFGKTGHDWNEIYKNTADLIHSEALPLNDFCQRYRIDLYTSFYVNLRLEYLCGCEKEVLLENAEVIANYVSSIEVGRIRPLLRNYVTKVPYEEMPLNINDAIFDRLLKEGGNETLGLSKPVLQQIRSLRFVTILKDLIHPESEKLEFYASVAASIRQVEKLSQSFFTIDFGNYIVLDCTRWKDESYAYTPAIFQRLLDGWKAADTPAEGYWPAMGKDEISTARELVLGLKKANVIKLCFECFDRLYAKDVLTITRYG